MPQPSSRQQVFVAWEGNVLLGFACAYLDEDPRWGCLLDNIHVRATAHRRGLGSQLLSTVAGWCAAGAPSSGLYLWVLQSNASAQQFYRAHGADNVGTDVWHAPGGTHVPRFRLAWRPGKLPFLA